LCGTELYIGRRIQELEDVPEPLEFYRGYVSMNLPVVIRGAVKHWPAVHLWTSDYLRFSLSAACTLSKAAVVLLLLVYTQTDKLLIDIDVTWKEYYYYYAVGDGWSRVSEGKLSCKVLYVLL